jgi:hypothetical protein
MLIYGCSSEHIDVFPCPSIGVELYDLKKRGFKEVIGTDVPTYFLSKKDTTIFYGFGFDSKKPRYKSWEIKFDSLDFNMANEFMIEAGFMRRSCISGEMEKEDRHVYFNPFYNQHYEIVPGYLASILAVYYYYPVREDD